MSTATPNLTTITSEIEALDFLTTLAGSEIWGQT
jgi:hypothetical protein